MPTLNTLEDPSHIWVVCHGFSVHKQIALVSELILKTLQKRVQLKGHGSVFLGVSVRRDNIDFNYFFDLRHNFRLNAFIFDEALEYSTQFYECPRPKTDISADIGDQICKLLDRVVVDGLDPCVILAGEIVVIVLGLLLDSEKLLKADGL